MKKKRVCILLLLCLLFLGGCGSVSSRCGSESTGPFTEFCLTTQSVVGRITAGPDGALWFTGQLGKIGRITVGGTISEFALPDPNYGSEEITAGPDGALWFTEWMNGPGKPVQSKIGRITVGGTISEFAFPESTPPTFNWARGITAGPDGALWFTDLGKIGRITVGGTISEFALPDPGSNPNEITAGPDGALWFTEMTLQAVEVPGLDGALWLSGSNGGGEKIKGPTIGRITIQGQISEFALPDPNHVPEEITAGPDGALWFTEEPPGKIGRITVGGKISEFALPNPDTVLTGITAGPDGALWFTEPPGKIGRLSNSPLQQT